MSRSLALGRRGFSTLRRRVWFGSVLRTQNETHPPKLPILRRMRVRIARYGYISRLVTFLRCERGPLAATVQPLGTGRTVAIRCPVSNADPCT
jgi:hypothetical protein